ncbi:chemotaxis protein [Rhizobium sp. N122]|nr:chemotaxis protein [Rhizobium sp. N122]
MVETMNGSGPNTTYQGRDIGDLDPVDQKAKFCAEIAAFANAAMDGNLTRRMNADYTDPDLRRSAALLNELISSIDDNLSDFNDAMAAFAHGDLRVGMRDKHRGAFRPLQKNFNLAVATIRTVLGERGSERFTDKATKFRRMMAAVRVNAVVADIRASDEDSRSVPSPPHDLWLKLAEALRGSSV